VWREQEYNAQPLIRCLKLTVTPLEQMSEQVFEDMLRVHCPASEMELKPEPEPKKPEKTKEPEKTAEPPESAENAEAPEKEEEPEKTAEPEKTKESEPAEPEKPAEPENPAEPPESAEKTEAPEKEEKEKEEEKKKAPKEKEKKGKAEVEKSIVMLVPTIDDPDYQPFKASASERRRMASDWWKKIKDKDHQYAIFNLTLKPGITEEAYMATFPQDKNNLATDYRFLYNVLIDTVSIVAKEKIPNPGKKAYFPIVGVMHVSERSSDQKAPLPIHFHILSSRRIEEVKKPAKRPSLDGIKYKPQDLDKNDRAKVKDGKRFIPRENR
jgi:hypothetical protein